ncbi:hypothetical protein ACFOLK_16585 [Marinococcus halophilus]|uniref:hypothetical protein n=1 Tax=Marinococcus halophilus TaxID=1371 RepID=UPI00361AC5DB
MKMGWIKAMHRGIIVIFILLMLMEGTEIIHMPVWLIYASVAVTFVSTSINLIDAINEKTKGKEEFGYLGKKSSIIIAEGLVKVVVVNWGVVQFK